MSSRTGIASRFAALLLAVTVLLPPDGNASAPTPDPHGLSVEIMAGAMIMAGFRGLSLEQDDPFLKAVRDGSVGHVILFDKDVETGSLRNIASPDQVRRLTETLRKAATGPFFIAVDQEGGQVRRLKPEQGFTDMPSARALGRGRPENTSILAKRMGRELADLGIDVNFAPVVDLDTDPLNPAVGKLQRSFSADPAIVSKHARAFGEALQSVGVIPVLKHFPGHGASTADSHDGPADITAAWSSQADLKPYVDAFQAGWPGMVMVGHLSHQGLDAQYPATLSKTIVQGLLRTTLGWDGVVISDDMQMDAISRNYTLEEAILLAVNAGIDILLFGNNLHWDPDLPGEAYGILLRLIAEGKIPEERILQSWRRIVRLYNTYHNGILTPYTPSLTRIR